MKYFLSLLLLLLCLTSCRQKKFYERVMVWPGDKDTESMDRNNGFKDLKLGHHISSLIHLLKKDDYSSTSDFMVYQVKPDSLVKFYIDEIKIKSIEAHFVNDLLYRFRVEIEGEKNSLPFYLLLLDAYGGAYPEDTYAEEYKWKGDRVLLKYKVDSNRNASAEFTSLVIMKAMGAAGGYGTKAITIDPHLLKTWSLHGTEMPRIGLPAAALAALNHRF